MKTFVRPVSIDADKAPPQVNRKVVFLTSSVLNSKASLHYEDTKAFPLSAAKHPKGVEGKVTHSAG
jgi:hypothetical protein